LAATAPTSSAVAAQLMRRILVDFARARHQDKRGGAACQVSLDEAAAVSVERVAEFIALDEALEQLAAIDPRRSRMVELRFFGGLSEEETAEVLKVSPRAASALNHPNIITIHEIGEAEDTHYIVTEYVEGETLRQRMTGAPQEQMKPADAIETAAQIAAALTAAHEAGIMRRDIKPENVMVRRDGYVKVLDFGLAKLTEPSSPAVDTQAATVAGGSIESGVVMGTRRESSKSNEQDRSCRQEPYSSKMLEKF